MTSFLISLSYQKLNRNYSDNSVITTSGIFTLTNNFVFLLCRIFQKTFKSDLISLEFPTFALISGKKPEVVEAVVNRKCIDLSKWMALVKWFKQLKQFHRNQRLNRRLSYSAISEIYAVNSFILFTNEIKKKKKKLGKNCLPLLLSGSHIVLPGCELFPSFLKILKSTALGSTKRTKLTKLTQLIELTVDELVLCGVRCRDLLQWRRQLEICCQKRSQRPHIT